MRYTLRSLLALTVLAAVASNAHAGAGVNDDAAFTPEDSRVVIDVLSNDTLAADGPRVEVSVEVILAPLHGDAVVLDDGRIDYLPAPDFNGADAFVYQACKAAGDCGLAAVDIAVLAVNDAPSAHDDRGTLLAGTLTMLDVLGNDIDVDGDPLLVSRVALPSAGETMLEDRQVWLGIPPDANGRVTFAYTVCDPAGLCTVGTVEVAVSGSAKAPTANDDSAMLEATGSVTVDVLTNDVDDDGDSLVLVSVTQPVNGSAHIADNELVFDAGTKPGIERLRYVVCDIGGMCAEAGLNITITIPTVNRPPRASDDSVTVVNGASVSFDVLANDIDADADDMLSVATVVQGAQGTTVISPSGLLRYNPRVGARGTDFVRYTVCDSWNVCDDAQVTIEFVETSTFTLPSEPSEPVAPDGADGCGGGPAGAMSMLGLIFVALARRRAASI